MLAKIGILIEEEQQAKRAIEEYLASGKGEFDDIFRKHLEEKNNILEAAKTQREMLKKQFVELQSAVDASYEQFGQSQQRLQNLV